MIENEICQLNFIKEFYITGVQKKEGINYLLYIIYK
jgi:hypothetical protein